MKRIISSTLFLAGLASLSLAHAHEWKGARPDGHAPIGVMGDHTHKTGEVMFSYRYMQMTMDGNRDGSNRLSTAEVLADYMVAPLEMDMDMHMFGAMYAPNDNLTLMAMLPYVKNSMKHITRMGREFTTKAEGIGDIKLSGLYQVHNHGGNKVHLNLGLSVPTGSIDERDDTPAAANAKLPYPMQLGSGTYDLMPGITYLGQNAELSWGAQALATIRLGENDNDYTLGDKLEVSGWLQRKWSDSFSTSVRLDAQRWGDIDGADPDLNPMMVATADPDLRAGSRVDVLLGVNYYVRSGGLKGHRIALEVGKPVYQKLDGPQLETDLTLMAGWQYAF
ncbi:transporter [Sulfuriflexus mobilis]|uniref:transporter n=1 Tax=Sulfuriflexus mobilis TaxID=1811807 RepID=UPI000F82316B|nr:transporter [Sulfuriflexus mobilis]